MVFLGVPDIARILTASDAAFDNDVEFLWSSVIGFAVDKLRLGTQYTLQELEIFVDTNVRSCSLLQIAQDTQDLGMTDVTDHKDLPVETPAPPDAKSGESSECDGSKEDAQAGQQAGTGGDWSSTTWASTRTKWISQFLIPDSRLEPAPKPEAEKSKAGSEAAETKATGAEVQAKDSLKAPSKQGTRPPQFIFDLCRNAEHHMYTEFWKSSTSIEVPLKYLA